MKHVLKQTAYRLRSSYRYWASDNHLKWEVQCCHTTELKLKINSMAICNCANWKKGITLNIIPKENTYNIVWISHNYNFTELWDQYYK